MEFNILSVPIRITRTVKRSIEKIRIFNRGSQIKKKIIKINPHKNVEANKISVLIRLSEDFNKILKIIIIVSKMLIILIVFTMSSSLVFILYE
jgi:hypothetical protein